jgi:tetratricopeptide (TPR) repeat protein
VRVTAQLVRAEDGFHLWSDTYDGSVSDGFDMQTRIAESVALALDVVLDDRQRERMRIAGLRDPEAFITLQKGVDLFQGAHGQGSDKQLEELQKANVYFEQVMESVPGYADAYAYHVDYFIHVALEQAETGVMPPEAAHDLEVIRELAQKDLDAAVQYAADAARKAENELTRAIFSENWRGLSAMVESALRADNCSGANWANIVSAPYGMADLLLEDSLTLTVCDPINPDGHTSAVAASIWLKDFDQAVKIGEAALNRVRTEWLISTYVTALVGHDQLAEAREAIRTLFRTESWAVATELLLAAHEGNLELAADLNERSSTSGSGSDSWQMMHKARLGDHDGANHHAALIDARPLGPMKLAQSIYLCFCGAPFDLEATPNFAKQLKESGLAWPPPESIRFPLKDW